ncbi:uncharacterized protein LOC104000810 isoform X2 [Musa acuminata AAA Group]|uniref:uncharacterized protein LOC104000810 isoform X2 n=1 Tax=Musa acuminata AAA Group TaxID=214697 RepID=UPI0031D2D7BB
MTSKMWVRVSTAKFAGGGAGIFERPSRPIPAIERRGGSMAMASVFLSLRLLRLPSREAVPYGTRTENPFCRTRLYNKSFICRKSIHIHGSFAAVASMLGRNAKKRDIVIPEPDYRIPVVLLGIAGGLVYQDNLLPAATIGLLGFLLLIQATRVRFVFDEEALEVKIGNQLEESGENVFVGGKNRWRYSTFVNWEFWWPQFPILIYFKETQTKPEGQIHFFPVIFLYDVMVERAGPSKTSGPK